MGHKSQTITIYEYDYYDHEYTLKQTKKAFGEIISISLNNKNKWMAVATKKGDIEVYTSFYCTNPISIYSPIGKQEGYEKVFINENNLLIY